MDTVRNLGIPPFSIVSWRKRFIFGVQLMTILAYVITIVAAQFCLLAGSIVSFLLALLLAWVPTRVRVVVAPFLGSIAGPFAAFGVAYIVFAWLTDGRAWGFGAVCAAMIPLAIPVRNDYRKQVAMAKVADASDGIVRAEAMPDVIAMRSALFGYLVGIIAVFGLFLATA